MARQPLANIPTNLITGFLGCGKTSAILDLLAQKPDHGKWAVLVNEFGETGIDGAIYKGQGVAIKEIPGGCLCCTAGVPLQTAINQLLRDTHPKRLLIEASGLGHPGRVIDTLRGKYFRPVLDLRATICLIDPRNLLDARYTRHETFNDQIALADVLIANKTDISSPQALQAFHELASRLNPAKRVIAQTRFGHLDLPWLEIENDPARVAQHREQHDTNPDGGWKQQSWVFPDSTIFHLRQLEETLLRFDQPRIKALVHTEKGWRQINLVAREHTVNKTLPQRENRIVVIHAEPLPTDMDKKIRATIARRPNAP